MEKKGTLEDTRDQKELEMLKLSYMDSTSPTMPVIAMLTKSLVEEKFPEIDGYAEHLEPQYIHIFRHANVIPISYKLSREEMKRILTQSNGLCLPGGHCNIYEVVDGKRVESLYTKAGRTLIELAIEINDSGTYFPVYGVCLGFELMAAVIGKDIGVVEACKNCLDCAVVLEVTEEAKKGSSKIMSALSESDMKALQAENISYNVHTFMVDPAKFAANKLLSEFFNVVSLSPSSDGSFRFVSTIEAKKYPFYAFQHHPEWGIYNFYRMDIHPVCTEKTKEIAYTFGDFFANEARRNHNRFTSPDYVSANIVSKARIQKLSNKGYVFLFKSPC